MPGLVPTVPLATSRAPHARHRSPAKRILVPAAGIALLLVGYTGIHAATSPEPAPSGTVGQWIADAEQILEANGTPASVLDTDAIAVIIQGESGGNPRAINNWDSNALAGHPSKGLMQCIDSTFDANKLPGHDDILNPVDNIVAGVRYAIGRYGSLANVPGVAAVRAGGSYIGY